MERFPCCVFLALNFYTCFHVLGLSLSYTLQILSKRSSFHIAFLVNSFLNPLIDWVAFPPLLSSPLAHVPTTECPCINLLMIWLHFISVASLRIRNIFLFVSPSLNPLFLMVKCLVIILSVEIKKIALSIMPSIKCSFNLQRF